MRRGGTFRGVMVAWLGLIALDVVSQKEAAGRLGGLIGAVAGLVDSFLDPDVPGIRDHKSRAAQETFNRNNPGVQDAIDRGGSLGHRPLPSERIPVPAVPK